MASYVKCIVQGCFQMVDRETGEDVCERCKRKHGGLYNPHEKKVVKDGSKEEAKL